MKKEKYKGMGLLQFQRKFPSEASCWKHLIRKRWGDGFVCPKCKHTKCCVKVKMKLFRCYGCGWNVSPTIGTLFHGSHVPLRKWFWAIYLMSSSKKGVSSLYLQRELELGTYRTAWRMAQKIRKAMKKRNETYRLGGVVEADEIWLGAKRAKKKYREDPNASNTQVAYLVQVQESVGSDPTKVFPKFARIQSIENCGTETLIPAIEKTTEKGSILKTDGHQGYWELAHRGYEVQSISANQQPKVVAKHLYWVNMVASNLKRFLLSTHHGVHRAYRDDYVAEFEYRLNRRFWPKEAFDRLFTLSVNSTPCFVG